MHKLSAITIVLIARTSTCILFIFVVTILHSLGKPPETFVVFEESVPRGSVATIGFFEVYGVTNINIELLAGTDIISRSKAHSIDIATEYDSWIALLGIPSYVEAGQYMLKAEIHGGFAPVILTKPLIVEHKDFERESIVLDERLTSIRVDNEKQRRTETQELVRLFDTFNPTAYYHDGLIVLPIASPRVTSHYADRRIYRYADGTTATSIHNGIDYGASQGTAVLSIASGMVVMSKSRIVTGNSVVIEHLPGIYSTYYHLDQMFVEVGDTIAAGELIATVGSTGLSTGPHLHWELRVHGVAVEPLVYLSSELVDINQLNQYASF